MDADVCQCELALSMVMAVWLCSSRIWTYLLVDCEAESPGRVLCPANPRPYVNSKLFSQVLADFAQHFGIGQDKHLVLVVDQAGWHTSEQVQLPTGIH